MAGVQDKKWVGGIGGRLRDDHGHCPTLPEEMLSLIGRLQDD
jgi:hypothetical protein